MQIGILHTNDIIDSSSSNCNWHLEGTKSKILEVGLLEIPVVFKAFSSGFNFVQLFQLSLDKKKKKNRRNDKPGTLKRLIATPTKRFSVSN